MRTAESARTTGSRWPPRSDSELAQSIGDSANDRHQRWIRSAESLAKAKQSRNERKSSRSKPLGSYDKRLIACLRRRPVLNIDHDRFVVVRHGQLRPEVLWEQKAQWLKKSGTLSLHRGSDDFASLGGLSALKAFCKRSLLQPRRDDPRRRPRGVLLLGLPGVGKSAFCRALGNEVSRPTLTLDVGSLFGSLVGETERNIRQALRTIDAMQPTVVMVDEIEKSLSGSGGSGDSGVSTRLFGSFLTWLSDHESDVYVVASCNDISKLPPEFSRAERWDAVFFVDLPGRAEKDAIWRLYLQQYELDRTQRLPDDTNFTGAEIKSCCRLAALLDLPVVQATQNVVPVAVTAAESVERLRSWASGRCLSADQSGIYQRSTQTTGTRRRVSRDASTN